MRENGNSLLDGHTRKPLQKLINRCTGLQVFEEGSHGYTSAFENPRAADFVWPTLYFLAITPIAHAVHVKLAEKKQARRF